jgi:hypothetical protein
VFAIFPVVILAVLLLPLLLVRWCGGRLGGDRFGIAGFVTLPIHSFNSFKRLKMLILSHNRLTARNCDSRNQDIKLAR